MENFELKADLRETKGSGASYRDRQAGIIPAVFYGKEQDNIHLTVKPNELDRLFMTKNGTNTIIKLKVDGKGDFDVILKEYQADPITRQLKHADFVAVNLKEKIKVSIPIHLEGRSVGVKEGGILEQITRELEVLCLPTNIPTDIKVDISNLGKGDNLHLEDIQLPEGSEPVSDTNVTIASIVEPREEKQEEAEEGEAVTEPEVIGEKKAEDASDDKKDG